MPKTKDLAMISKWLVVAGAAVSVGLLPKGWQKGISAATAALVLINLLVQ